MKEKILLISAPLPEEFAGVAARNLYNLFKQNGHEIKILTKYYSGHQKDIIGYHKKRRASLHQLIRKIHRKTQAFLYPMKLFSYNKEYHVLKQASISVNKIKRLIDFRPSIIFILFHHNFLSHDNISTLSKEFKAKIVWQLVDMGSFTGGCHYSWDCQEYIRICKQCPAAIHKLGRKRVETNFKTRENSIKTMSNNLDITIGSDWLLERAEQSAIFREYPIHKVYLTIDSIEFPIKTEETYLQAKSYFNIDPSTFVISFGSQSNNDKRKGLEYVYKTISKLPNLSDITFLVFGKHSSRIEEQLAGKKVICTDVIPRNELSLFYSASDVFINCSLQDVGPYTILEALVSNTNVISFNSGFAKEFINNTPDISFLVNEYDTDTMAKSIHDLYQLWKKESLPNVPNIERIRQSVDSKTIYRQYQSIFQHQQK